MVIEVFLFFIHLFDGGTRVLQLNLSGGEIREAICIPGERIELVFAMRTVKPPLWESSLPDSWKTIEQADLIDVGRSYTPLYWRLRQNINEITSVLDEHGTPLELRHIFYDQYSKQVISEGDSGFVVVQEADVYLDFRSHKNILFNKSALQVD